MHALNNPETILTIVGAIATICTAVGHLTPGKLGRILRKLGFDIAGIVDIFRKPGDE